MSSCILLERLVWKLRIIALLMEQVRLVDGVMKNTPVKWQAPRQGLPTNAFIISFWSVGWSRQFWDVLPCKMDSKHSLKDLATIPSTSNV